VRVDLGKVEGYLKNCGVRIQSDTVEDKRLQDESSVNRITHNLSTPELLKAVSSLTKDCQEQQNKLERVGKVF
jgi:hypothetical protein